MVVRLARAGCKVIVTELERPLAVRRAVAFAQAVYSRGIEIEGIQAQLASHPAEAIEMAQRGTISVLVDPDCRINAQFHPQVVVDGRMRKKTPESAYPASWFSIGLGPGFIAGENCDAAIETMRGHTLGRVYWQGSPAADTGLPESVANYEGERVLRAPASGVLRTLVDIGDILAEGEPVAQVGDQVLTAKFRGVVRGLLMDGLAVNQNMKIGDLDPRCDPALCYLVSDKALAVGGGVMEAILSVPELRKALCSTP